MAGLGFEAFGSGGVAIMRFIAASKLSPLVVMSLGFDMNKIMSRIKKKRESKGKPVSQSKMDVCKSPPVREYKTLEEFKTRRVSDFEFWIPEN